MIRIGPSEANFWSTMALLGNDEKYGDRNVPNADDGWTVVHGKKTRASVKKRDDPIIDDKEVAISNKSNQLIE